jgi:hypothetical protein
MDHRYEALGRNRGGIWAVRRDFPIHGIIIVELNGTLTFAAAIILIVLIFAPFAGAKCRELRAESENCRQRLDAGKTDG